MIRGLDIAAESLGIPLPAQAETTPPENLSSDNEERGVPMMYRAQVGGRCSLMLISQDKNHLETWTREWLYPKTNESDLKKVPDYRRPAIAPLNSETVYRIQVDFPFRLYTDCGQDSIKRPVLGRNGIPFFPGSSVKGLFRRACTSAQAQNYCGDKAALEPGCLRFHGAYPVGNWGDRINDLVHPQEEWQIGSETSKERSAYALVSLYEPKMVFEFSTQCPEKVDWAEVETILRNSLSLGIGGKTSTGYGRHGSIAGTRVVIPPASLQYRLEGIGVSSTLRTGVLELRPNMFKAALRGHTRRLLAGACEKSQISKVDAAIDQLFGSTQNPGTSSILWFSDHKSFNSDGQVPTYQTKGRLYVDVPEKDVRFMQKVVQFAYTMGGFGKTWRRAWHKKFMPTYKKRAIGCYWSSPDIETVQTPEELTEFLEALHQLCRQRMGSTAASPDIPWRETWHPQRLAVYCRLGDHHSQAVDLFHDETFKTTLAIGGKSISDKRPISPSSVWHRMLPVENNQYLEIVTVFHGVDKVSKAKDWNHAQHGNQLLPFVQELQASSLNLVWGKLPAT